MQLSLETTGTSTLEQPKTVFQRVFQILSFILQPFFKYSRGFSLNLYWEFFTIKIGCQVGMASKIAISLLLKRVCFYNMG